MIKSAQNRFSFRRPRTPLGKLRRSPEIIVLWGREIPPANFPSASIHSASRCPIRVFKWDQLTTLILSTLERINISTTDLVEDHLNGLMQKYQGHFETKLRCFAGRWADALSCKEFSDSPTIDRLPAQVRLYEARSI